jgi:hypothetical protein
VIELDEFERSKFGESGNVNISISSMKIKNYPPCGLFGTLYCLYSKTNIFDLFHIQG